MAALEWKFDPTKEDHEALITETEAEDSGAEEEQDEDEDEDEEEAEAAGDVAEEEQQ